MKITKRGPEKSGKSLDFNEIQPGIVFRYADDTVALKIDNNKAVLLVYDTDSGIDWLDLADAYKTDKIAEILGKLVEMVVEKE